jgi:DNA-binding NarL/FixJ family response regulator
MYDEALYADRVLRAGGDGYIMKEESPDEIIDAIRDVLDGHIYVSEEVMEGKARTSPQAAPEPAARPLDHLTDLELNVMELLGRGKNNDEIAERLGVKAKEVAAHCNEVREKLKLKTDNALIHYAVRWVETGAV